jgi:hypothetical protein
LNFTSFFSAIALAALVLINLGSQTPVKGDALQTDPDSLASVQAQLANVPDTIIKGPVISINHNAVKHNEIINHNTKLKYEQTNNNYRT